jgi:(methylthio)acryloyl-CoA hydratase
MTEEIVTYECIDNVALIGLNRVAKRNALNRELLQKIGEAATRASDEALVAVVYSHGDHFCAGLDLKEAAGWMHSANQDHRHRMRRRGRPLDEIVRAPIPFVAAIRGACIGGGLEIACACHLRVADSTAFFALPEGQRGIYVGSGGSVRIARLLGLGRMTDLMLTGRVLTADEGERYNIVQYLVEPGQHLVRAKSLAARIAQNAPMSNWAVVNGLPRIQDTSHEDGLFVEGLLVGLVSSQESTERLTAFVEKRAEPLVRPGKSGDEPS